MCCLYCGKEIGAFRLLRDSEFCSIAHRKKYGERLGKALHNIAEPEPAPAGVAGFLVQMPLQQGNIVSALIPWHTDPRLNRIRTVAKWPLAIDTTEAPHENVTVAGCAPVECPPQIERWMPGPPAEPVAAFVQASAAAIPAFSLRAPRFAAMLAPAPVVNPASQVPIGCGSWMPAPQPEPVAAFVETSAAVAPVWCSDFLAWPDLDSHRRSGGMRPLDARARTGARRRLRTSLSSPGSLDACVLPVWPSSLRPRRIPRRHATAGCPHQGRNR